MSTTPVAYLNWSLYVDCPACKESNDLAHPEHDNEHETARRIFSNDWDKLKGKEVHCGACGHDFTIERVEY